MRKTKIGTLANILEVWPIFWELNQYFVNLANFWDFLIKTLTKIPDPSFHLPKMYLEIYRHFSWSRPWTRFQILDFACQENSWHLSVLDRRRWLEIFKYSLGKQSWGSWILSKVLIGKGIWKYLNTALASKIMVLESCPRSRSRDPKNWPKPQNIWQPPKILGNLPKNWPKSQNIE